MVSLDRLLGLALGDRDPGTLPPLPRSMQLYVDIDGVLAAFDRHCEGHFGARPCKIADNVMECRRVKDFYANLSPMADFKELWAGIERHRPIVLTAIPSSVAETKRAWGRKYLGEHVEVRCCWSGQKFHHAAPSDVLIDGWEKYRDLWDQTWWSLDHPRRCGRHRTTIDRNRDVAVLQLTCICRCC